MPTLGELRGELSDSFGVVGSDEGVIGVVLRLLSITLDEQIERDVGFFRLVRDTGGGISGPMTLKVVFRDLLYLFDTVGLLGSGNEKIEARDLADVIDELECKVFSICKDQGPWGKDCCKHLNELLSALSGGKGCGADGASDRLVGIGV